LREAQNANSISQIGTKGVVGGLNSVIGDDRTEGKKIRFVSETDEEKNLDAMVERRGKNCRTTVGAKRDRPFVSSRERVHLIGGGEQSADSPLKLP